MNVLMVGNTCSMGWNLKKGLSKKNVNVTLVSDGNKLISGKYDYHPSWFYFLQKKYGKKHFDIVHLHSPNLKHLGLVWRYLTKDTKLVCHWHGSDLRMRKEPFSAKWLLKEISNYHLYSTIDLAWWLRDIPDEKKMLFRQVIDTEMFKPLNRDRKGTLVFGRGGIHKDKYIPHDKIPELLNRYEMVKVFPAYGLSPYLVSASALEAASCGCKIYHHPYMDREWVKNNTSTESQTEKLINIYNELMK